MEITNFSGEYEFLSNFYEVPVRYEYFYGSSEAAYQAQKAANLADKLEFLNYNPKKAKKQARKIPIRADWDSVKISVMRDIVFAKFTQNPELAEKLLATGDSEIVEGNYWHDTFWGVDDETGEGKNNLGKILMELRAGLNSREVEILSGENLTLTRFTLPEKTKCGHLNFAQKFEIESTSGKILNCKYKVRGRIFDSAKKSFVFRNGDDIILISGDCYKISIYIGLEKCYNSPVDF